MRRSDQTYKEIKLKLNKRAKDSKKRPSSKENVESYVDSSRGALAPGNNDLKNMIQKFGLRSNQMDFIPEILEPSLYVKQAKHLMKKHRYSSALKYLNFALRYEPTSLAIQTARARCHLKMGNWKQAKCDADNVLSENGHFLKAIFAKAESLYNTCDFEHALVHYHRGLSLAIDKTDFRLGIRKCRETILNGLMNDAIFCNSEIQEDFLKDIRSVRANEPRSVKEVVGGRSEELKTPQLKGGDRLADDKRYFRLLASNFESSKNTVKTSVDQKITQEAECALAFLHERESFWKQLNVGG